MSPLLFALVIEPLAIALRQSVEFREIERGGHYHKLSLYADDLLLYVSVPQLSIPHINYLEQFGRISGCKINIGKNNIGENITFPIRQENTLTSLNLFLFKYLRVEVTCSLSSLFTKNFKVVLEKCKEVLV